MGQTLHQDYYPLSLIQVGLHFALVKVPAVLTGRRDISTDTFLNDVKQKTTLQQQQHQIKE